jgi:acylphosphatase
LIKSHVTDYVSIFLLMEQLTCKLLIAGRVQRVSFRAWTRDRALELGVRGTVRNLPDGTVEAIVQGPKDKVEQLVKFLWKGPLLASVRSVQEQIIEQRVEYNDFRIEY